MQVILQGARTIEHKAKDTDLVSAPTPTYLPLMGRVSIPAASLELAMMVMLSVSGGDGGDGGDGGGDGICF